MALHLTERMVVYIRHWLEKKASFINHKAVMKDVYLEVDITAGYFLMLTLANLIALSGLITNNTAVIIGAMLISPLMGPILSAGFSFTTGDAVIGRKAAKKLLISVALTIVMAALATLVSPLKEVTAEIVARTRPNLYDLAIAFFSGTAGAIALCTKKNFMTVVPGVAIATAVIPPLSVAGYGLGTGKMMVAMGGFFLFFTNFVAIVVCTCIIFYVYGFRPAIMTEEHVEQAKKRVAMLAGLLFVISIPLIYTLVTSISAIRLKGSIETMLRKEFDRERHSHLVSVNYRKGKNDAVEVKATVNTVQYLDEDELKRVEKMLGENLQRTVVLDLEQIQVRAGGLKDEQKQGILPAVAPPEPPEEVTRSSIEGAVTVARKVSDKLGRVIAPSSIAGFQVGFEDGKNVVSVLVKIRRDRPLSDEQGRWLQQIVSAELAMPADVTVETVPFVSPLVFGGGEVSLTEAMQRELTVLKAVNQKGPKVTFALEGRPESGSPTARKQASQRLAAIKSFMVEKLGIPGDRINTTIGKRESSPTVRVTVTDSRREARQ